MGELPFEDFCEFGLGMSLAYEKMRARLDEICGKIEASEAPRASRMQQLHGGADRDDSALSRARAAAFIAEAEKGAAAGCELSKQVLNLVTICPSAASGSSVVTVQATI